MTINWFFKAYEKGYDGYYVEMIETVYKRIKSVRKMAKVLEISDVSLFKKMREKGIKINSRGGDHFKGCYHSPRQTMLREMHLLKDMTMEQIAAKYGVKRPPLYDVFNSRGAEFKRERKKKNHDKPACKVSWRSDFWRENTSR